MDISGVLVLLFVTLLCSSCDAKDDCISNEPMKQMLDGMQQMFTGANYSETAYNNIRQCMTSIDPVLPDSQDAAWEGIIQYWLNNVNTSVWGESRNRWMEQNITIITEVCDMPIFEPCNYASNVAYYYTALEICARNESEVWPFNLEAKYIKALVQAFSMVGMGSSFMHGTNTHLGGSQDGSSNDLFAYLLHQASISSLPYDSIIFDLSEENKTMDGIDMAQAFTDMYIDEDVDDWGDRTDIIRTELPSIEFSYTGYFSTLLTIGFDDEFVDDIVGPLADIFSVPEKYVNFTRDFYLPALREAIGDLELSEVERVKLIGNGLGAAGKLIYAFLWQEHVLDISGDFFLGPIVNRLGWKFLPEFNQRMGQFQTYPYSMPEFQRGEDIYPGDDPQCNPVIPHAKWHLQSAIGILDTTHLADDVYRVLLRLK